MGSSRTPYIFIGAKKYKSKTKLQEAIQQFIFIFGTLQYISYGRTKCINYNSVSHGFYYSKKIFASRVAWHYNSMYIVIVWLVIMSCISN